MLQETWKKKENGTQSKGTMESSQKQDSAGKEEPIRKNKKQKMEREQEQMLIGAQHKRAFFSVL